VSWEGHLAGALAGAVMAIWYRDDYKPDIPEWMREDEEDNRPFFQKLNEDRLGRDKADNPEHGAAVHYHYRKKNQ
jgi:hypothetical protein